METKDYSAPDEWTPWKVFVAIYAVLALPVFLGMLALNIYLTFQVSWIFCAISLWLAFAIRSINSVAKVGVPKAYTTNFIPAGTTFSAFIIYFWLVYGINVYQVIANTILKLAQ